MVREIIWVAGVAAKRSPQNVDRFNTLGAHFVRPQPPTFGFESRKPRSSKSQGKRHLFGCPLSAFGFQYSHLSPLPTNLKSKFVSRYAGAGSANSVSSHSCDCPRWSRMLLVAFAGWGDVAADVAGIIALIPLVVVFAASDSAFVAGCSVIVEILIDRAEG